MNLQSMPAPDPAPEKDAMAASAWPQAVPTTNTQLDQRVQRHLAAGLSAGQGLGYLQSLAMQLARVQQNGHSPQQLHVHFTSPQLVVFAADHGIAVEGLADFTQDSTQERAVALLEGRLAVNTLARTQGFDLTLVDAGLATPIERPDHSAATLLLRKIGYGTRNMVLAPAMSLVQARSAIEAGMDVVRLLPGNLLALSDISVAGSASAQQLLSRLCDVPLATACATEQAKDPERAQRRLERLFAAASRHRKATTALEVLAALGGFEIGMLCGAMLQGASERRVVMVDGFVASAAALLAKAIAPGVCDYLVFTQCSSEPGHRLLLTQLQAHALLQLDLQADQGLGALLAWPLIQAAQRLLTTS